MADVNEYRRQLASGTDPVAATQEYKMAQDRELILKELNGKYRGMDGLTDERLAQFIKQDHPELSLDLIQQVVPTNRVMADGSNPAPKKRDPAQEAYSAFSQANSSKGARPKPQQPEDSTSQSDTSGQDTGGKKNANQVISQHLDNSTYFGSTAKAKDASKAAYDSANQAKVDKYTQVQQSKDAYNKANEDKVAQYTAQANKDKVDPPVPPVPTPPAPVPPAPAGNSSQPAAQTQESGGNLTDRGYPSSKDPMQGATQPAADPNGEKKGLKYYAGKAINTLGKGFYDALANADSASFKRDINAKLRGQPTGNLADVNAETARNYGRLYENDAANRNMEAQREAQEGDRNPFYEAGKIAEAQQSAQNKQTQNNLAGGAGNKAFLQRTTVTPDVQAQKEFGSRARQLASQYREKGDMRTRDAAGSYGESDAWKVTSRDYNNWLNESDRLSMGRGGKDEGGGTATKATDTPAADNTAQDNNTQPAETQSDEEAAGGLQNVINAARGSSVRRVKCENGAGAAYLVQPDGSFVRAPKFDEGQVPENPPPYTAEMEQAVQKLVATGKYNKRDDETEQQYTERVNGELGRGGNRGTQAFSQNYGNTLEMGTDNTESDARIKDIHRELSDFRMKCIKEDYDNYGELSPDDIEFIIQRMGKKFKHGDREYDFGSEEDWDDEDGSVLSGYAENIRNYVYNYKPEAQNIDPSIDPNEEHIGPMAQDIEKVNPACIKETPDGVKTVDTGRLALMNAGAIADLARRFDELEALIKNGR